jgi:hypothetical protein
MVNLPEVRPAEAFGPAAGVASVAIGDEVVLYRVADAATLVLNATAGLLWQCLDGSSRLDDIFSDLAEAFGADPSAVEGDCLPIVRRWLAEHLVEKVDSA